MGNAVGEIHRAINGIHDPPELRVLVARDAFLAEQRERYAAQRDAYAEALGDASRGLYFPLHKGWREW